MPLSNPKAYEKGVVMENDKKGKKQPGMKKRPPAKGGTKKK